MSLINKRRKKHGASPKVKREKIIIFSLLFIILLSLSNLFFSGPSVDVSQNKNFKPPKKVEFAEFMAEMPTQRSVNKRVEFMNNLYIDNNLTRNQKQSIKYEIIQKSLNSSNIEEVSVALKAIFKNQNQIELDQNENKLIKDKIEKVNKYLGRKAYSMTEDGDLLINLKFSSIKSN